jgi:hypothetical protein
MLNPKILYQDFRTMWYVSNLEIYAGTHPAITEHNMAFIVVEIFNQKVRDKGHEVYIDMDTGFSSPANFYDLWAYGTKVAGTVGKELQKQAFAAKSNVKNRMTEITSQLQYAKM